VSLCTVLLIFGFMMRGQQPWLILESVKQFG